MNLYLAIFTSSEAPFGGDAATQVIVKKIIRHSHGEKAAQFFYDELRQQGYLPMPEDIDITLLLSDGPIGIVQSL